MALGIAIGPFRGLHVFSGNIKAIGAQRFRYDAVSRLVEAKIWVPENNPPLNSFDDGFETGDACNWEVRNPDSGCVAGAHQLGLETYTYDPYGNLVDRTTVTSEGATQVNTPADPQTNRLQGASSYDDEGHMTGWNGALYDFDALGQMVRMRNGSQDWLFAYSTGGERIVQIAEGGLGERRWTMRDAAGRVLREWVEPAQGTPSWTRDWIYRGTQILATVEPQQEALLDQAEGETSQVVQGAPLGGPVEVVRHLTLDHLGTPRLVTDDAGTNLAFHIYWPYGREATDPLQNELRKKFTGHERDSYDLTSVADELDYMHARFANPMTGKFLSVDPFRGSPYRPQTLNRFAYVGGNPVAFTDPTGRFICSIFGLGCPTTTFYATTTVTADGGPASPPNDSQIVIWNVNWGTPGDDDIDGGDDDFFPGGGGGGGGGGPRNPAPPGPEPDDPNDDPEGPNEDPFTEAVLEAFAAREDPCGSTTAQRFHHRREVTRDFFGVSKVRSAFNVGFNRAYSAVTGSVGVGGLAGNAFKTGAAAWRAGLTFTTVMEISMSAFSSGLQAAVITTASASAVGYSALEAGIALGSAMGATSSCLGD